MKLTIGLHFVGKMQIFPTLKHLVYVVITVCKELKIGCTPSNLASSLPRELQV
jgi:hypothetical protein